MEAENSTALAQKSFSIKQIESEFFACAGSYCAEVGRFLLRYNSQFGGSCNKLLTHQNTNSTHSLGRDFIYFASILTSSSFNVFLKLGIAP